MSNINYTGNAAGVTSKYDLAIGDIKLAIEELEIAEGKLNPIVGFEGGENLKKEIRSKITYLNNRIIDINREKGKITDRSISLQKAQEERNKQEQNAKNMQ